MYLMILFENYSIIGINVTKYYEDLAEIPNSI